MRCHICHGQGKDGPWTKKKGHDAQRTLKGSQELSSTLSKKNVLNDVTLRLEKEKKKGDRTRRIYWSLWKKRERDREREECVCVYEECENSEGHGIATHVLIWYFSMG